MVYHDLSDPLNQCLGMQWYNVRPTDLVDIRGRCVWHGSGNHAMLTHQRLMPKGIDKNIAGKFGSKECLYSSRVCPI